MIICKEMEKFREILDSNGIEWDDKSTERPNIFDRPDYVCRTHFKLGGNEFNVINCEHQWDEYDPYLNKNNGLLECYCIARVTNKKFNYFPGYVTAEEAWNYCCQ